mmetsp:Transcript_19651/g.45842  ORF Transcript_19651/g.45842 Transcript_19651/m.45842 type:complete len:222 (-) Transcript_19651:104-769(-)
MPDAYLRCPMIGRSASYPRGMIFSWTISPRIPAMAARPLLSSMARLESFSSSSKSSHPKSMYPFRKSPTNSFPAPGTSFMKPISRNPTKAISWTSPEVGMESGPTRAATPLGKESKESPFKSMLPGRWIPARVVICPRKASIQIRPCLISTYRRRSNRSWSTSPLRSPRGSKNPSGGWAPSSSSNALTAVEVAFCCAGAKAAAVAMREAKMADFILRYYFI